MYEISRDFRHYFNEKPRPAPDIRGERRLAGAILKQWLMDLNDTTNALRKARITPVIKGLVYDLKSLWYELDSKPLRFWSQVAGMDPYHLRRTFVIKVNNLIESRPDLKPFLKVFPLE